MGQSPANWIILCKVLSSLHKTISCNDKFGFHVTTSHEPGPQSNGWYVTWKNCFTGKLNHMLLLDTEIHSHHRHIRCLFDLFIVLVISRLLCVLDFGGYIIIRSFLHGELRYGKSATVMVNGRDTPMVYDACTSCRHSEYHLGGCQIGNKFGQNYFHECDVYFSL